MAGKYKVYRCDDGREVTDVFVLKAGDVLAVAALRSYANNCMTLVELDRMLGHRILTNEERIRIISMTDEVLTLAEVWESMDPVKLPD